tara:strand:+ start:2179 stop:2322 length:144 start_codon:yes stop_codon:yes gene_type:complete
MENFMRLRRNKTFLLPYQVRILQQKTKIGRYFMSFGFVLGLMLGWLF